VSDGIAARLYRGDANLDIVGRRKIWYGVTGLIILIAILSFAFRGFELGIEFKGGNSFQVPARVGTLEQVRSEIAGQGVDVVTGQRIGGGNPTYRIQTGPLSAEKANQVAKSLQTAFNLPDGQVSTQQVSGAWGAQITKAALIGVLAFVILVVVYLLAVFREWRMPAAAIGALVQNLLFTATVYSLVGFEITPSTVIGFLTILGFALYDVVVVFDKVRENTRGFLGRSTRTFAEEANLAVNQTLMRSINTAVVALLPVGGLLFIGAGLLGAGTLKDLGLVLFVGMLAAVYSSIFLATPVLVDLTQADPKVRAHTQRVLARRQAIAEGRLAPKTSPRELAAKKKAGAAKVRDVETDTEAEELVSTAPRTTNTTPRPGSRPQPRKAGAKPGSKPAGRGNQKRR
jgi:preprotein translocase subunit SecF